MLPVPSVLSYCTVIAGLIVDVGAILPTIYFEVILLQFINMNLSWQFDQIKLYLGRKEKLVKSSQWQFSSEVIASSHKVQCVNCVHSYTKYMHFWKKLMCDNFHIKSYIDSAENYFFTIYKVWLT